MASKRLYSGSYSLYELPLIEREWRRRRRDGVAIPVVHEYEVARHRFADELVYAQEQRACVEDGGRLDEVQTQQRTE